MEIKIFLFVILAVPISITFGRFIDIQPSEKLATPGEFPHLVQLSSTRTGETFCGGSIIHPSVILTPAVCLDFIFKRQVETILATAGRRSLKEGNITEKGEQTRTVAHFEVHPGYLFLLFKDNLALVYLTEPFNLTEKVQPVSLTSSNQTYSRGTVAGWNYKTWGNVSVTQLSKFTLELNERKDCNKDSSLEPRRFKVTDTELCGKLKKESGICKIPMGSSLICEENAGAVLSGDIETSATSGSVLCGMATWGKGFAICGEKDLNQEPISVFQDVSKYVDWIQERLEENLKTCSEEHFDCGIGQKIRCIPVEKKCNGVNDCSNGSDENKELCGTNILDSPSDTPDVTPESHVKVEVKWRPKPGKFRASENSSLWLLAVVVVGMKIMLLYYFGIERIENIVDESDE